MDFRLTLTNDGDSFHTKNTIALIIKLYSIILQENISHQVEEKYRMKLQKPYLMFHLQTRDFPK